MSIQSQKPELCSPNQAVGEFLVESNGNFGAGKERGLLEKEIGIGIAIAGILTMRASLKSNRYQDNESEVNYQDCSWQQSKWR